MDHDAGKSIVIVLSCFVALILVYIYASVALSTIAKKTDTKDPWLAWVPIGNLVLMANVAEKPIWWGLLLLIPYVSLVFMALLWMKIAERRNFPGWYGILTAVPLVNLFVIGYLAFADRSPPVTGGPVGD